MSKNIFNIEIPNRIIEKVDIIKDKEWECLFKIGFILPGSFVSNEKLNLYQPLKLGYAMSSYAEHILQKNLRKMHITNTGENEKLYDFDLDSMEQEISELIEFLEAKGDYLDLEIENIPNYKLKEILLQELHNYKDKFIKNSQMVHNQSVTKKIDQCLDEVAETIAKKLVRKLYDEKKPVSLWQVDRGYFICYKVKIIIYQGFFSGFMKAIIQGLLTLLKILSFGKKSKKENTDDILIFELWKQKWVSEAVYHRGQDIFYLLFTEQYQLINRKRKQNKRKNFIFKTLYILIALIPSIYYVKNI
jgi:hypothetical protein